VGERAPKPKNIADQLFIGCLALILLGGVVLFLIAAVLFG
jgi:hypothetical protein